MTYRILVINPGSTSTKVGACEGEKELFSVNVSHDAEKLKEFATVSDQLPYRKETILHALDEQGIDLSSFDAFVGRGGGLLAVKAAPMRSTIFFWTMRNAAPTVSSIRHSWVPSLPMVLRHNTGNRPLSSTRRTPMSWYWKHG